MVRHLALASERGNEKEKGRPRLLSPSPELLSSEAQQVQLADFEMGRTLGCGSFGRVKFAKYKPDGKFYAVKTGPKCPSSAQARPFGRSVRPKPSTRGS